MDHRHRHGQDVITPQFLAQGLIDALVARGTISQQIETDYAMGGTAVLQKLGYGFSDFYRVNLSIAAFRNSTGLPRPHPQFDVAMAICRPMPGGSHERRGPPGARLRPVP